ncbi:hypothetical protein [Pyxidicoccus fallax]|nr:hypothetical protein [Pyxidicoccus fallax]
MNTKKKLVLKVEIVRILVDPQPAVQAGPCSSTRPPTWAGAPDQA